MEQRPIRAEPRGFPDGAEGEPASFEMQAIATHWRLLLATMVVLVAAATGFVLLRQPVYESRTQLLVENAELQLFREEPIVVPSPILPSLMETQVRLIASRGVAVEVVERLNLADDPEFNDGLGLMEKIGRLLGLAPAEPPDPERRKARAVAGFMHRLDVGSLGLSTVVEIGFASRDAAKAARIANATADVYRSRLAAQADARAAGASAWVQERLETVGTRAEVISQAAPPVFANGPRGLLIVAAAAVAGTLMGVVVAIAVHLLDGSARTPEQLAAALGTEFLGFVPRLRRGRMARPGGALAADDLPGVGGDTLGNVEAALRERWRERAMVLGVSSIAAGEGTTLIARTLAVRMARHGLRVLLVDGNGFDPAITREAGLRGAPGLREALAGAPAGEVVVRDASGVDVLPVGGMEADGPVFLLPDAGPLVARLRAEYQVVVVDLPPVFPSADVRAAGSLLDAVLIVVSAEPKSREMLRRALAGSGRAGERLIGFVVNRAPRAMIRRAGAAR